MTEEDAELLAEFRTESLEHLEDVEQLFVEIAGDDEARRAEVLNAIFRAVHSIKGAAGFFDLHAIGQLAHASENLLMKVRDGEIPYAEEMTDALLSALDKLRQLVNALPELLEVSVDDECESLASLTERGADAPAVPSAGAEPDSPQTPGASGETGSPLGKSAPQASPPAEKDAGSPLGGPSPKQNAESIRVPVPLLDQLMNLAGELVLARNQLISQLDHIEDGGLRGVARHIDLVTSELQRDIMYTRMQPVGSVFRRFHRIARDMSRRLGKRVDLQLVGEDVELDKSIIELLGDPLTHLVRNALDHGIERADERAALGKPETARLLLSATHENGLVNIEIADDGRGIDAERMRAVAVDRGIVDAAAAARLSDSEARALVFAPGFSTATEVTDLSGRGVGMDVVQSNIKKLGGKIDIESELGIGTTVRIRLPLTLAILPSLIVGVGEERFAIPQVNLAEIVGVQADEIPERVETIRGTPTLRHRDGLLPLIWLADVLAIPDAATTAEATAALDLDHTLHVLVLRVDRGEYGLVVDRIQDPEEIVVKPLSEMLKECRAFVGSTIMGDGRVAMILDVAGVAARAELVFDDVEPADRVATDEATTANRSRELLVFTSSPEDRFAIEVDRIVRLERVEKSDLECVNGRDYMQYRGSGLRLLRLDDRLDVRPFEPDDSTLLVLIPRIQGTTAGILVREVVDTVHTSACLDRETADPDCVLGRAVVGGHVTLLLDPQRLVDDSTGVAA